MSGDKLRCGSKLFQPDDRLVNRKEISRPKPTSHFYETLLRKENLFWIHRCPNGVIILHRDLCPLGAITGTSEAAPGGRGDGFGRRPPAANRPSCSGQSNLLVCFQNSHSPSPILIEGNEGSGGLWALRQKTENFMKGRPSSLRAMAKNWFCYETLSRKVVPWIGDHTRHVVAHN